MINGAGTSASAPSSSRLPRPRCRRAVPIKQAPSWPAIRNRWLALPRAMQPVCNQHALRGRSVLWSSRRLRPRPLPTHLLCHQAAKWVLGWICMVEISKGCRYSSMGPTTKLLPPLKRLAPRCASGEITPAPPQMSAVWRGSSTYQAVRAVRKRRFLLPFPVDQGHFLNIG
jgi:hypothetical protein